MKIGNYDTNDANPYPGAPKFFKRYWSSHGKMMRAAMIYSKGTAEALLMAPADIVIYGWAQRSNYEEDRRQEDFSWRERDHSFLSVCFSPAEPGGEIGFTPAGDVIEISEEEFLAAHQAGWPQQ